MLSASVLLISPISFAAASEFGPEATKRGEYYVCPDGGAARSGVFFVTSNNFWSMDWGRSSSRSQVDGINAKIFIGKAVASYTNQEIDAIFNKFLYSEIVTPSVYVSRKIGYSDMRTRISLENGEGRSIKFVGRGTYGSMTDTKGRTFDKETNGVMTEVFCPSGKDYILRRIVERLSLKASDEFGESKNLPLIFMVTNFYIKKGRPSMENVPSF